MIDVFKVGVHIGMTSNASQVLSVMLRELTGLHIAAGKLEKGLGTVMQAAVGAGAIFAGWEVGKGIWHAIEGNRELNKELEKTKQLGGDFASHIDKTRAAAFQATYDAPTSVASHNVRLAREIGVTLGHPDAVDSMLPEMTKAAYVVHNYTGEKEEDIIKNLMRTADLRAQIYSVGKDGKEHVDGAKLIAEINAAVRGLIVGGQFVTSADMLQTARQGGAVAKEQTPEAFYAAGTEAAIAVGSSRLGTAETSLMQQFIGGTMTKKVATHLTEAGLLKPDEWSSGKSGGVVVSAAAARRFEPMMKDPIAWLESGEGGAAVRSYAEKEGISVTAAIMQLFSRQTTQRLVNDAMSNEPQFARAREIYGNIPDVNAQYKEQLDHNLDTNMIAISAAWKSFMEAFSDSGTPLVIPILHGLTDAIQFFTRGVSEHPLITEALIGLTAGLAALSVLGGSLVILNVCWAPLATGLGALVAIPGLVTAGVSITAIGTALTSLVGGVIALTGPIGAAIAVLGVMKPSATNVGEEKTPGYEGRFGSKDPNILPHAGQTASPYVAPATTGDGTGKRSGDIYLDGKKVGMIIDNHSANSLSRPPTGSSGPDYRISPLMPGIAASAFG